MTYCSTGPALCVLEKLVHIDDPSLLPEDTVFVRYAAPNDLQVEEVRFHDLPDHWRRRDAVTMRLGNDWLDGVSACLLRVPSVILPIPGATDRNLLVNHRHEDARRITISRIETFRYDSRLFTFG